MKMTHTGYLVGCDARTPSGYRKKTDLRETKNYWVTGPNKYSGKYRKRDGWLAGDNAWPPYTLDLDSIEAKP